MGKALTVAAGTSAQAHDVVRDYYERTGRLRGRCRSEIEAGPAEGTSVRICRPRLPDNLGLDFRIRSPVFGRYPEQRFGQVDIEGVGSLDSILQEAGQAQRAGDEAAARAAKMIR